MIRYCDLSLTREALRAQALLPEINASLRWKGGVVYGYNLYCGKEGRKLTHARKSAGKKSLKIPSIKNKI